MVVISSNFLNQIVLCAGVCREMTCVVVEVEVIMVVVAAVDHRVPEGYVNDTKL